jgi:quercetin dioxygenase-like cupin family protein
MSSSDSRLTNGDMEARKGAEEPPIVRRGADAEFVASRRPGLRNAKLLAASESAHQNWVLTEAETGAFVEDHVVPNSESFFVLEGEIELFGPGWRDHIGAGDFVYFRPGQSHGMRVVAGPARYLVVFAPRRE